MFAAKTFVVCSFLAALYVAGLRLHGRAMTAPRHAVALGAWAVVEAPEWVTDERLLQVREDAGLATSRVSLLAREGPARVGRRLAEAPDVRRVVAVERRLPNRLRVALELRRPAALVQVPRPDTVPAVASDTVAEDVADAPAWWQVDAEGVLLRPGEDGRDDLARIVGARTPEVERGGRLGPDVRAAVELAARLARAAETHRELGAFDVIDVSNWAGRRSRTESEVVVSARPAPVVEGVPDAAPCRVEWGRIGERARGHEPDFPAKRDRLLAALDASPRLGAFEVVRVAFHEPWVVPRVGR